MDADHTRPHTHCRERSPAIIPRGGHRGADPLALCRRREFGGHSSGPIIDSLSRGNIIDKYVRPGSGWHELRSLDARHDYIVLICVPRFSSKRVYVDENELDEMGVVCMGYKQKENERAIDYSERASDSNITQSPGRTTEP